jgi:hypothetical protein
VGIVFAILLLPVCAQATGIDFYSDGTIQDGNNYDHWSSYDYIALHDSATVTMTGGKISIMFDAYDYSNFNLQDGLAEEGALRFHGFSTATMIGGTMTSGFNMYDNSVINITGGTLAGFDIMDSAVANLYGGQIGGLYSHNIVNIYGKNIVIEPYGTTDKYIHGLWGDGTPFSFFALRAVPYNSQFIIHEIPEPAVISLLLMGFLGVRKLRG